MSTPLRLPLAGACFITLAALSALACSGSTTSTNTSDAGSSGSSGSSGAGAGFDCAALRDKQASASCPKFDGAKYLTECEQTKSAAPPACKPQLDAFANCVLGQPIGCTASGSIDDTTAPACKAADAALEACFADAGAK